MADDSKRLIKCKPNSFISNDWQASRVRFTHNEIERKRRARLKSETDFLHQQLPRAVYRDKLAIFKAGTELLRRYGDCNGPEPRNLIITDNEYSACIFKNFDGFGMGIRCRDGQILSVIGKWEQALSTNPIGKTIFELIVPNDVTEAIISENLTISQEEQECHLGSGQPVGRSFILPMAPTMTTSSSSEDSFFLVECCGDIVLPPTASLPSATNQQKPPDIIVEPILQIICRVLERTHLGDREKLFSLRLQPDSYLILEITGRGFPQGISPADVIGQSLVDLTAPACRPITETNLQNAERTGEAIFTIDLACSLTKELARFRVVVKAITVYDYLQCLVADFFPKIQHN